MKNDNITKILLIDEHRCGYFTLNALVELKPGEKIYYDGYPDLNCDGGISRPREGDYAVSENKGIRIFYEGNSKNPKVIGLKREYHLRRNRES